MKKIITSAIFAVSALGFTASAANELPTDINGFFRLNNAAFQESLSGLSSYNLGGALPDPCNPGSVLTIRTDKMWSMAEAMDKLQQMLDAGEITQEEHFQMFYNIMTLDSWKSGMYPVKEFTAQGQDFMEIAARFPDWADAAIEAFLNNDAEILYKDYRDMLTMLCVFATDIIKPVNLETVDTFKAWCESYLTKWRSVADFGLYMQPVYSNPPSDPEDETPMVPTGEYYLRMKTPPYVGSLQKAQIYINNMLTSNGTVTDVDTLNIWNSAKHYMLQEIEKEYPAESPVYNFVHNLFGNSVMNMEYAIGESEEGGLRLQPLPDAFNSQNITLTADDLERCKWMLSAVNDEQPLAVRPSSDMKDADGRFYSTLNLTYPARIVSPGVEIFYATAVNEENGVPALEQITGDIIPAYTPVFVRSISDDIKNNIILPLDEESAEVPGNILKGSVFETPNNGSYFILGASDAAPVFCVYPQVVPANSAYYEGSLVKINTLDADSVNDGVYYDLLGREVKNPAAKGIYIVNGKKVVK